MNDYVMNAGALVLSIINLIFNLYHSNIRSPYWWCDPKGLMAFPLFLSTAGLSIYYVSYGEYPKLFGLQEDNIPLALLSLIVASWAFTAGTFLTIRNTTIRRTLYPLYLRNESLNRFCSILIGLILLVSLVSYYGLYTSDFFTLLSLQYGTGQWETIDSIGAQADCSRIAFSGSRYSSNSGIDITRGARVGVCV